MLRYKRHCDTSHFLFLNSMYPTICTQNVLLWLYIFFDVNKKHILCAIENLKSVVVSVGYTTQYIRF